jgi:hypothetical protein
MTKKVNNDKYKKNNKQNVTSLGNIDKHSENHIISLYEIYLKEFGHIYALDSDQTTWAVTENHLLGLTEFVHERLYNISPGPKH